MHSKFITEKHLIDRTCVHCTLPEDTSQTKLKTSGTSCFIRPHRVTLTISAAKPNTQNTAERIDSSLTLLQTEILNSKSAMKISENNVLLMHTFSVSRM